MIHKAVCQVITESRRLAKEEKKVTSEVQKENQEKEATGAQGQVQEVSAFRMAHSSLLFQRDLECCFGDAEYYLLLYRHTPQLTTIENASFTVESSQDKVLFLLKHSMFVFIPPCYSCLQFCSCWIGHNNGLHGVRVCSR